MEVAANLVSFPLLRRVAVNVTILKLDFKCFY
jgi:hypothetical protein